MPIPSSEYREQARLVVSALPHVAREACFALKGGTAINLFLLDMPRLSVDIDLVYLGAEERTAALQQIDQALGRVRRSLVAAIPRARTRPGGGGGMPGVSDKFMVEVGQIGVKVEVNHVFRRTVWPPSVRRVAPKVEAELGFAEVQVASFEDIYAGKIAAALDRQHPRDLFDVKLLLDGAGVSDQLFRTFLVYLIAHNRPIAELIDPSPKDVHEIYEDGFAGMTADSPSLEALLEARARLVRELHARLTDETKRFLLSVKRMAPEWDLLDVPGVAELPAVRWKLRNLAAMLPERHAAAVRTLSAVLDRI